MKPILTLQKSLSEGQCALIFSSVSRRYLTGFSSSDGILLVRPSSIFLYLDSRYFEMATLAQKEGNIPEEITLRPFVFYREFSEFCQSEIREAKFEEKETTVFSLSRLKERYPKILFSPLGDIIEKSRMVKSEAEIEKLRTSQALAEAAFSYVLPRLAVGRTELEVAAEIEFFMRKNGATEPSFPTICVSGARSSLPHGTPSQKTLERGDFITLDFGCMLDGYASDMTRTVCLGKATDEMKAVYDTVLRAQASALAKVSAGVLGKVVDAAARDVIRDAGYGEYFGHSTGHGIGLSVHEAPNFAPSAELVIPSGACLSVEPGIYLPGKFGVRIEDLVVVREGYGENLNQSTKELLEIS